ncbi:MAG: AAA family ATPase [Acidimicrobiales bacterium]
MSTSQFNSSAEVELALKSQGYLPSKQIATTVFLADRLSKPILVEGPAGTGKTELAKSLAAATGHELVRLQCYEGLDEAKALFEWNYRKQLLHIQAVNASEHAQRGWNDLEEDIFSESFLLERPLLHAIRSELPTVLLIDEVDRLEVETEALLLEILAEFQVTIPELGTVRAKSRPMVVLTSNGTRELSEALKRRCLFLYLDYPDVAREREILMSKVEGVAFGLAEKIAAFVATLRSLELKKSPSISETIDWCQALLELDADDLEPGLVDETLHVLLKYRTDFDKVHRELLDGKRSTRG